MSPKVLDHLLIGRFGNRRINSLVDIYSTNMGVVQDVEELAMLVEDYYKQQWNARWGALTVEYDPTSPYHVTEKLTQKDERDVMNGETVNITESTEGTVKDTGTRTDESEHGESTTTNSQASGSDSVTLSGSDSEKLQFTDRNDTDIYKHDDTTTNITNGSTKVKETGSETVNTSTDGDNNYTETFEDHNLVHDTNIEVDPEEGPHGITSHSETSAKTTVDSDTTTTSGQAPYDSAEIKNVASSRTVGNQESNSSATDNQRDDKTLDQNFTHVKTKTESDSNTTKSFDGRETETQYDQLTESSEYSTRYTNELGQKDWSQDVHEKHGSEDTTTTYGKVETDQYGKKIEELSSHQEDDSRTITDDLTKTTDMETTTSESKSGTVNDSLERSVDSEKKGNMFWLSNQQLIAQELELRKKNFYDSMLKDVVTLLTLSVY